MPFQLERRRQSVHAFIQLAFAGPGVPPQAHLRSSNPLRTGANDRRDGAATVGV
jgi:hypothetical protein